MSQVSYDDQKLFIGLHSEGYDKAKKELERKINFLKEMNKDLKATAKYFKSQDGIFKEIQKERIRQDEKYGKNRNEPPLYWFRAMQAESSEVYMALENNTPPPHDYRTEMIQLVSLGIATIESWDRQKEKVCTPENNSRKE